MEKNGAFIERGIITEAQNGSFRVASYSRPGVTTPPIKSIDSTVSAGDKVYFFLFTDGGGMIIGKL